MLFFTQRNYLQINNFINEKESFVAFFLKFFDILSSIGEMNMSIPVQGLDKHYVHDMHQFLWTIWHHNKIVIFCH